MPKLSPSPHVIYEACDALDYHVITVEDVIRHMDAANAGLDRIEAKYPTLFSERRGPYSDALHQIKVSTSTMVWRSQLTYLKMLIRRLREEALCQSSSLSSPPPSQLGMQHTSMEDTQRK